MKNDFYITGESYAGHYIPAFANRVYEGNNAKEGIHINLKVCSASDEVECYLFVFLRLTSNHELQGFAIGNGLTDPAVQYRAYPDYALEMGLIKDSDYERINKYLPACELAIKLCGNHLIIYLLSAFLFS